MCTGRNAKMGIELMEKICASGKLDKCEITISYSKYK